MADQDAWGHCSYCGKTVESTGGCPCRWQQVIVPQTTFTIQGPATFPGAVIPHDPPPYPPVTLDPETVLKDRDRLMGLLIQTMIALQLPIPETPDDWVPSAARVLWKRYERYRKIALASRRLIDAMPCGDTADYIVKLSELPKLRDLVREAMPGPISNYTRQGDD